MIWLAAMATAACAWLLMPVTGASRLGSAPRAPFVEDLRRRLHSRGSAARQRERAIAALTALASELRAGQPPLRGLAHAAGRPPVWPSALRAADFGGDVAEGLQEDAKTQLVLRPLAACWAVCAESGSGLAAAVERLAASARGAEELRLQLAGQLAGPRATARTLSMLPLIGIALGILMGADPLGWLLGTAPGMACLVAGVVLAVLGALWTGAIARNVERRL